MKVKTCRCESLKVKFIDKATVHIQGGWIYGSPHTHAVCFECRGRIRIAYSIVHVDSEGKPFHPKRAKRKTHAKPTRRKARQKDKGESTGTVWRFVD